MPVSYPLTAGVAVSFWPMQFITETPRRKAGRFLSVHLSLD